MCYLLPSSSQSSSFYCEKFNGGGDVQTSPEKCLPPRPKSPWTPSYSVNVQGSPRASSAEMLCESPHIKNSEVSAERLWIPSYSVNVQGSPRIESADLPCTEVEKTQSVDVATSKVTMEVRLESGCPLLSPEKLFQPTEASSNIDG